MTFEFSPEVGSLLQDLADNPVEAIAKLAQHRAAKAKRGGRSPRTGPSLADALAEGYRFEVATLLGQHAVALQHADPLLRPFLHRSLYAGRTLRIEGPREIERSKERLHLGSHLDRSAHHALTALAPPTTTLEVAMESWRLWPSDAARLAVLLEHFKVKHWSHCRSMAEAAVRQSSTALNHSIAWETAGMLCLHQGQLDGAIEAYRTASRVETERPAPLCTLFVLTASMGNRQSAEGAARTLDDLVDDADLAVEGCIATFEGLRSSAIFQTHLREARAHRFVHGSATQRIVDVLP